MVPPLTPMPSYWPEAWGVSTRAGTTVGTSPSGR